MNQLSKQKMPAQSIVYLLVCGTGILAFIFLIVYPYQKSLSRMDERIAGLQSEIESQKVLVPFFRALLTKKESPLPESLPFPGKEKLDRHQTQQLSAIFQKAAVRAGARLADVVPDLKTVAGHDETMALTVTADGELQPLRSFLFELLRLPFFESMSDVSLRTANTERQLQVKIWVYRE